MQENAQPFDIKRYLTIILRRKYIALSVGLAALSICTWGSFLLPKIYEARSTVFIEKSSIINPIQGLSISSNIEERLRTIRDSITTRNIIERVIKKLGMDAKAKNAAQYEGLIDDVRENLYVRVKVSNRETDLFTISYTGGDPSTVMNLVNTLVNEYIEENLGYRRTDVHGAYEFIQSQLLEYNKKLDESDTAIREFRERNPYMVPRSETTLLGRLEGFETARLEAEIRLKELLGKRDNLQKQFSGENELTVASPQSRLKYLNNQLMLLMPKYTDNYPEVIKVKSEIEELKRQIDHTKESYIEALGSETAATDPIYQQLYQQLKEELVRTDAEIESLRARSAELLRQQQGTQRMIGHMPKEQEEWSKLQRDRNVYQKIYNDLLQKLEGARISKDIELTDKATTFRVVDPAVLPLHPVKPDKIKMILVGIFLGIASGIGTAIGLEYLDHSFKDEDSIESKLKLPVLITIPRMVIEADELSAKRLDRRVFLASGAYLFIIGIVLIEEFISKYMGIKIINF